MKSTLSSPLPVMPFGDPCRSSPLVAPAPAPPSRDYFLSLSTLVLPPDARVVGWWSYGKRSEATTIAVLTYHQTPGQRVTE